MSKTGGVLGVMCLLATACGGSGDEGTTSRSATTGSERVVTGIEATEEEAALPYREPQDDETLGALSRTGTGIVHDADDATWETPLPPTADPLDEPERSMRVSTREICPADIEGLVASFASLPRGGALVFTAEGAVDDLRARLSRFVDVQRQARAAEASGQRGPSVRLSDQDSVVIEASSVRLVDVPGGARLELEVDDDARVSALQEELRYDAEALSEGRCPLAMQVGA